MKKTSSLHPKFARWKPALFITAAILLSLAAPVWAGGDDHDSGRDRDRDCDERDSRDKDNHGDRAEVVRPNERYHGKTYAEWSAATLQWAMEFPLDGHPAIDSPDFDVSAGQSGNVWFLAGPFGTVERTCTIPKNKALFISLANAEVSSLEPPESGFHGDTEAEQRELARFYADHIVPASLFCVIDGVPVKHLERYRVSSPQYEFIAPTPWLFGDVGGEGTSVGDGYYVMVKPLSKGRHIIRFGGMFHFTLADDGFDLDLPVDMTYHLTMK